MSDARVWVGWIRYSVVCSMLVLASCGVEESRAVTPAGPGVSETDVSSVQSNEHSSQNAEITISTSPVGGGRSLYALGRFRLRFDQDRKCVYLEDTHGSRVKPVWLHGARLQLNPLRVLNARGGLIASVNEPFSIGGGYTGEPVSSEPTACGAMKTWTQ